CPQAAQEPQIAFVPRAVLDCADVALELGIGVFTEDHDRHVRLALELTRGTELRGAAGGAHDGLDCGENRLAVREILVAGTRALPGDRPPAALLGNVVRAIA